MNPWLCSFALFVLPAAESTHAIFQRAAERTVYLDAGDVIWGRVPGWQDRAAFRPAVAESWRPVFEGEFAVPELIDLLADSDPRIRSLAAARLFAEEDPALLHHLLPLLEDPALTLPATVPCSVTLVSGPLLEPQRVGEVVGALLRRYVGKSGARTTPQEYLEARAGRAHCLSWFEVRLDRITHGASPLVFERSQLRRLRDEIDALPPAERDWTTLAIFRPSAILGCIVTTDRRIAEARGLVHDSELVQAARRRGREALLEVLRGVAPTEDPDWPGFLGGVQHLLRERAGELFTAEDVDDLLRIAEGETDSICADLCIAVAHLSPAAARPILDYAFERVRSDRFHFDAQAAVLCAMWTLVGPSTADRQVAWFFAREDRRDARHMLPLIQRLAARWNSSDRVLIARLIADERSQGLDETILRALAQVLNQKLPVPVVPQSEVDHGAPHPQDGPGGSLARWLDAMRAATAGW